MAAIAVVTGTNVGFWRYTAIRVECSIRYFGLRPAVRCAVHEGPVWAVPYERPKGLDFNGFRNCQGVFKFNAKISHRAVHLGVTQQKLNSTQVARLLVDLCDLRPSH